jgi:hypothetical protein
MLELDRVRRLGQGSGGWNLTITRRDAASSGGLISASARILEAGMRFASSATPWYDYNSPQVEMKRSVTGTLKPL